LRGECERVLTASLFNNPWKPGAFTPQIIYISIDGMLKTGVILMPNKKS